MLFFQPTRPPKKTISTLGNGFPARCAAVREPFQKTVARFTRSRGMGTGPSWRNGAVYPTAPAGNPIPVSHGSGTRSRHRPGRSWSHETRPGHQIGRASHGRRVFFNWLGQFRNWKTQSSNCKSQFSSCKSQFSSCKTQSSNCKTQFSNCKSQLSSCKRQFSNWKTQSSSYKSQTAWATRSSRPRVRRWCGRWIGAAIRRRRWARGCCRWPPPRATTAQTRSRNAATAARIPI